MIAPGLGAACAAGIALLAYRARALSAGGAVAAFVVGASVVDAAGWRAGVILLAFFLPSAALTRVGTKRKRELDGAAAPRDQWQVLANGGVAAACALGSLHGGAFFMTALAGAFAAASADTWGTEIGTLARRAPVSILTLRPVATGISGGVTSQGTAATIAGALFVAGVAALLWAAPFLPVAAGGIAGALIDSLAGASLQALRWCPRCAVVCETTRHSCGSATELRRGVAWIANDAVNLTATLCGALVAGLAALGAH